MASNGKAFSIDEVVCGYHIYKDIWDAGIGSELPCYPESSNCEDRYAVAVMNDTHVVWPCHGKYHSFICHLFLCHAPRLLASDRAAAFK